MIAAVNPFDWRTVLLAKHAQHVVLIHFPIALCLAAVAFDLVGRWTHRPEFYTAAYCNFTLAAIATLPAILTGLLAWQWQLEGAKLKGNLLLHMVFALSASAMIWLLCGWRVRQRRFPQRMPGIIYIFLALATVLLIALAGHLGGIVSGVESGAT